MGSTVINALYYCMMLIIGETVVSVWVCKCMAGGGSI